MTELANILPHSIRNLPDRDNALKSRPPTPIIYSKKPSINFEPFASNLRQRINETRIYWAICMPDSCPTDDVARFLAAATGHEVSVRRELCTRESGDRPLTTGEIIFGSVMGGFFSIVIFCTCYDKYLNRRRRNMKRTPKSTIEEIVVAFSLSGESEEFLPNKDVN